MNVVLVVAGVIGLAVAAWFFLDLLIDAVRRREYLDVGIAVAVVVATVWLLFTFGDRLLQ